MTGIPEFNYQAFNKKAAELRALGHHVENPAENQEPQCRSWLGYMRMAIVQLVSCDAVVMLRGWENSRGARIEHQLASSLGLEILYQDGDKRE
jgi:sulfur relay (sulfurtransferase) complex TusBCD TusD component (DsrE family)